MEAITKDSRSEMVSVPEMDLRKWCIEKALGSMVINEDGNSVQAPLIETADKIYNWVKE
jgi:hypothetical protein